MNSKQVKSNIIDVTFLIIIAIFTSILTTSMILSTILFFLGMFMLGVLLAMGVHLMFLKKLEVKNEIKCCNCNCKSKHK